MVTLSGSLRMSRGRPWVQRSNRGPWEEERKPSPSHPYRIAHAPWKCKYPSCIWGETDQPVLWGRSGHLVSGVGSGCRTKTTSIGRTKDKNPKHDCRSTKCGLLSWLTSSSPTSRSLSQIWYESTESSHTIQKWSFGWNVITRGPTWIYRSTNRRRNCRWFVIYGSRLGKGLWGASSGEELYRSSIVL